jgi:hypothetical protein
MPVFHSPNKCNVVIPNMTVIRLAGLFTVGWPLSHDLTELSQRPWLVSTP